MSVDLNFWKYEKNTYLDNATVYQNACCNHEKVEGLEALPIEDILEAVADTFFDWKIDSFNYENKEGQGSFQISITPQTVRFDCYSMERTDMQCLSAIMWSEFGCPLYDPQQCVRYDKIVVFLIDEAGEYEMQVKREFSCCLPYLEITTKLVNWDEYVCLSKELNCIQYSAIIHRAKTLTKVTSYMKFGKGWSNHSCQCKTAQLEDKDAAHQILEELLQKSILRVINDFENNTYSAG